MTTKESAPNAANVVLGRIGVGVVFTGFLACSLPAAGTLNGMKGTGETVDPSDLASLDLDAGAIASDDANLDAAEGDADGGSGDGTVEGTAADAETDGAVVRAEGGARPDGLPGASNPSCRELEGCCDRVRGKGEKAECRATAASNVASQCAYSIAVLRVAGACGGTNDCSLLGACCWQMVDGLARGACLASHGPLSALNDNGGCRRLLDAHRTAGACAN
jgi:hypothetical protein